MASQNKLGGSARKHRPHRGNHGGVPRSASLCPHSNNAAAASASSSSSPTATAITDVGPVSTEAMAKALGTELTPPEFDSAQRERVIASWKIIGEHISEVRQKLLLLLLLLFGRGVMQ